MGEGAAFDELMKTKDRCVNLLSGLTPLVESALTVANMLAPAHVGAGEGELHRLITTRGAKACRLVFFQIGTFFWLSALHVRNAHTSAGLRKRSGNISVDLSLLFYFSVCTV